ncbi:MAG TPA: hypothetical protein VI159_00260, partial [Gemmatimonadales bacterium]
MNNTGNGTSETGNVGRRDFLGMAAVGMVSMSPLFEHVSRFSYHVSRIPKVGLQLYTVRDLLKTDFEGTLKKVAAIGYKEVELTDFFGRTSSEVKVLLDGLGLSPVSMHFDYAKLPAGLDAMIA